MIKKLLKPILPQFVKNELGKVQFVMWKRKGCPIPPPHVVKQVTIKEYQKKYNIGILVETGTFLGDMVEVQKKKFKKVYSIELAVELYNRAVKRFKNDKNVVILQGDSGKILPKILSDLNEPAIFWLDGHYSAGVTAKGDKECPIYEELDSIFNAKNFNHVLLIDDARCFCGEKDYPTIEELTGYIKRKNEKYQVEVKHDIIRYVI